MAETVRKLDWLQVHNGETGEIDAVTAQYTIITPTGDVKRIVILDPINFPYVYDTPIHTTMAAVVATTLVWDEKQTTYLAVGAVTDVSTRIAGER